MVVDAERSGGREIANGRAKLQAGRCGGSRGGLTLSFGARAGLAQAWTDRCRPRCFDAATDHSRGRQDPDALQADREMAEMRQPRSRLEPARVSRARVLGVRPVGRAASLRRRAEDDQRTLLRRDHGFGSAKNCVRSTHEFHGDRRPGPHPRLSPAVWWNEAEERGLANPSQTMHRAYIFRQSWCSGFRCRSSFRRASGACCQPAAC